MSGGAPGGAAAGAVDVTWVRDVAGDTLLRDAYRLLGADERRRHDRLRREEDRRRYLLCHALLRAALARATGGRVAPDAWSFRYAPTGRLEPAMPAGTPDVRFSLSRTAGVAACAVSFGADVGLDVESAARAADELTVATHFFAPAEADALHRLADPDARRARFLALWTLKEAYLKARGLGLSVPPDLCRFELAAGGPGGGGTPGPPRAELAPCLGDDAARWWFAVVHPTPSHVLSCAVAARAGQGTPRVMVAEWPAA